jgi:hypothetical protein
MSLYTPSQGQAADGICCECSQPAITEIQCGRHDDGKGNFGGQYAELCQPCYESQPALQPTTSQQD